MTLKRRPGMRSLTVDAFAAGSPVEGAACAFSMAARAEMGSDFDPLVFVHCVRCKSPFFVDCSSHMASSARVSDESGNMSSITDRIRMRHESAEVASLTVSTGFSSFLVQILFFRTGSSTITNSSSLSAELLPVGRAPHESEQFLHTAGNPFLAQRLQCARSRSGSCVVITDATFELFER
ncbi:hypothetical protein WOLCODRAFT_121114 [Wolfiporia cocos MD-104 SS10]|uniref:Uncharacterized protein n=1 Tax=Wolfiporia cocos (strain MD-104) TaxID=742152 RepID=A0A2H3JLU2_WOLCO|nr:hypothetical protein WOLCODRAFT_121114 [Wolfiporia cocos MD-104 SS10]